MSEVKSEKNMYLPHMVFLYQRHEKLHAVNIVVY